MGADRIETETDTEAASARRALREITGALGFVAVLLAAMLVAVLIADKDVVAAVGALALAITLVVAVTVLRRTQRLTEARNRALAEARAGRERLERTLAATRSFLQTESPVELRRHICTVAREVFACAAASLWEVHPDHLLLLERTPWEPPYAGRDRRPLAELPGLAAALDAAEPFYVADLAAASSGATQSAAEIVGARSLVNVPIAVGGVTQLVLGLLWDGFVPEPSAAERTAAQRFADQAGLALEQARYRIAQTEIATLNRTLQRMLQTDPLFRADGTLEDVAEAVCVAALDVFEASGAALWIDVGTALELVRRVPEVGMFTPRLRIEFAEHADFAEDLSAGHPRFIADVEHDDPVLWERFARHSGSRSQLRVPLASAGDARALLVLSWDHPVAPPSAEVSAIASRFADQAGVALAEAARREAQREADELHARFERSLLPSISVTAADADVAAFYRPGDERLTLGGDFYDCVELDDGSIALLVGDVAGHGAAAAALGAGLRSAWRALVLGGWPLERLAGGLQAVCVRERHDPYMFVTALLAVVDPGRGRLRYVAAGHPPPLTTADAAAAPPSGPPLGVAPDATWTVLELALPAVASVVLYTDGLIEGRAAPGSAERLGIDAVAHVVRGLTPGGIDGEALRALVELATSANGAGLADDVALLALNLRGPQPPG